MQDLTIVAAIQARMGSTRLPGKVLLPVLGKPLVWRIFERLQYSKWITKVVVATTTESSDDALAQFVAAQGIGCFRGKVDDIVQRLTGTAQAFDSDILVRIWGDCPFVDSAIIDQAIAMLLNHGYDYVSNVIQGERTFPGGLDVEVYRRQVLETIDRETQDMFFREFPFEYVMRHADKFRRATLTNSVDLSQIHITVDYPQDLELARKIYARLYRPEAPFSLQEILELLQSEPDMWQGNSELARNFDYFRKKGAHQ